MILVDTDCQNEWNAPPHLQGFDLVLEAVDVLLWDLLAGDLALDPLEPAVQVVEVLASLAELLLHGLLKGGGEKGGHC